MWKKWLSALLVLVAIVFCAPLCASASSDEVMLTPSVRMTRYASAAYGEDLMARYLDVDVDEFRDYLFSEFRKCQTDIDLSDFYLPSTINMVNTLCNFIWYQMPEAFNFKTCRFMYNPSTYCLTGMTQVQYFSFADTVSEFDTCWMEFERAADDMLYGIEGNTALSDEHKALLLHDRLAVWTEYDYSRYLSNTLPEMSYSAYGVFGKRIAVCQGYALAYDYLLERVGIRSDLCPSVSLDHIWNIVYIDGEAYHVDVTWDDPTQDVSGRVSHDNFLRSSNGIRQTGHDSYDYDMSPYSTRYDNYYWQSSEAEFRLVGDALYYLDNDAQTLKVLKNGTHSTLTGIAGTWKRDGDTTWIGNFSRLSSIGGELLYSTPTSVVAYDTATGAKSVVFTPNRPGTYYYIFGFVYENGELVCDVSNKPSFNATTKENGRRTLSYYGTYVKPASVRVEKLPNKTTYYVGDTVDLEGIKLFVVYTDGSQKPIDRGYGTSDLKNVTSVAGKHTVAVTYGGATGAFDVTVKVPSIKFEKETATIDCKSEYITLAITTKPGKIAMDITSSNTAVAYTVNNRIYAVRNGTTTITATFRYNGVTYTDTCVVKVNRSHQYVTKTTRATPTKNGSVASVCENCGHITSSKTIYAPSKAQLSTTAYTYNGSERKPNVTVKDAAGTTLIKNTHYTVTYPSGRKNAGTYKVKITFKGQYSGTTTLSFVIRPIDVSKCTVKLSATSYTYNGSVRKPSVTVKNANGTTLTKDTHYTVSYASGRKNAGTYKVTVKMKGNYGGTKTLSFRINPISITKCTVKLSKTSLTYNGSSQTAPVVVKNANGTVLTRGTHYTISRVTGCKNAGTHKMTVKMKGNYSGSKTFTYTIKPISIAKCTIKMENANLVYTGNIAPISVNVKNANGTKLSKNTHYTVRRLTGGVAVGEHKVLITMKGNYSGSKTLTYKIFPQTTTVTKLAVQGNRLTVYVAKRTAQVGGYQVEHSVGKSFSGAKTITVAGNKNTTIPVTIPSKKGTYYVRVRTYKDVDGVRYCSQWKTYTYERT